MSDARKRRSATADGRDATQPIRFTIVALCVLGTACLYTACAVVVLGGHIGVLFGLIPWLAATALGTIFVVTIWALLNASRERIRNRHNLTAERLGELAVTVQSPDPSKRAAAQKQLTRRVDVTRDALDEVLARSPGLGEALVSGGVAEYVEHELDGSGGKWHRVGAAGVLGLLGCESSLRPLERALDDADPDVAYAAAQALAGYDSPSAYAALLSALTKQRLPPARIAALLEASRCPTARELIEPLARSDNPRVRYWVAYLLASLGDPRSAPVVERLAGDPDEDVRANAAESLATFPNQAVLSRLLADDSWVVRSHAAKAAGVSGKSALAGQLATLLKDRSWWVRQNATLALAGFGDAALPALLAAVRSNDRFARNKAAEALIRSGYAATQVELVAAGLPGSQEARAVLVELGRAEALSTVVNAVRGASDPGARDRLLDVLEEIGTGQADAALDELRPLRELDPADRRPRLDDDARLDPTAP